jgi:hypothetical protein
MKKALADTGLVKKADEAGATKRKSTGKKGGKAAPSSVSAPKAQKTKSKPKKTTEPKKPRKQGGKGRPYQVHDWPTYAPGNKPPRSYSDEELKNIVKKAAKAANTRIRTLEKKGLADKAPAYKWMKYKTREEKPRFKEGISKLSREELEKEFIRLREFMIKKTSTVTGYREAVEKNVQRARDMGFTGTPEELGALFTKYMTEKNEALFGSDIIYQAIVTNRGDNLQEVAREFQARVDKDRQRGAMLLELLRKKRGK